MQQGYRSMISGQRKDLPAMLTRGGLRVASTVYGLAVSVRNRRYEKGSQEVHRCGVPVICIGNLTTGGTGKTPIVCYVAKWFREQGIRVAIVSRGYGRGDADENDEAMELHWRLPDVPHVQNPDRVQAARVAVEELESQLILMDDGFQHRRLHRDLNLLVVDATCPFGYGYLLPRGLLREPLSGIGRADLAMVTRTAMASPQELESIDATLHAHHPSLPIIRSNHEPTKLLEDPDRLSPIDALNGQDVAVVSAIGNPDAFVQTVKDCGGNVIATKALGDHDPYSPETVAGLQSWVATLKGRISRVVCTHKDLVKLQTDRLGGVPLAAVLIELSIVGDAAVLEQRFLSLAETIMEKENG